MFGFHVKDFNRQENCPTLVVNLDMLNHNDIMFNALKHHAGFVREFLSVTDIQTLLSQLKIIGNCQLDFYYGPLEIDSIYYETLKHLKSVGISSYDIYREFLQNNNGYYTIELTDHSRWILRLGRKRECFIHIHPARNSPHTLRVMSSALKTIIAFAHLMRQRELVYFELNTINEMRISLLDLPPVKKIEDLKAVDRVKRIVLDEFVDGELNKNQLTL